MNIKGFLTHLQTRGYSTGTLASYRSELQIFQTFLRDKQLQVNQVKPSHIEKTFAGETKNSRASRLPYDGGSRPSARFMTF